MQQKRPDFRYSFPLETCGLELASNYGGNRPFAMQIVGTRFVDWNKAVCTACQFVLKTGCLHVIAEKTWEEGLFFPRLISQASPVFMHRMTDGNFANLLHQVVSKASNTDVILLLAHNSQARMELARALNGVDLPGQYGDELSWE